MLARPIEFSDLVLIALATFGLACGPDVLRYADGTKRCEGRTAWLSGVEDGFWTYWYPNHLVREQGRFEHGHRTGLWEQWFPDGSRRSQGERRWNEQTSASEREGLWMFWHANGTRSAVGLFRAGKREGHWDYTLNQGGFDGERTGEYSDDFKID